MDSQLNNSKEVLKKIETGEPVVFKDHKIPRNNEDYYVEVMGNFLKAMGKERIFDHLGYCLREVINNAKKANTKRIFFLDEDLDISNNEHYEKGMGYFKDKTLGNLEHYLHLQEKYDLYVQIYFHIKEPYFNIIVSNNSPILKQEKEKIINRITRAKAYKSVEEAYLNILDDSEGAGLGIVILVLILKKLGISERNFAIAVENNMTHVRIAVPMSLVTEEEAELISDAIIEEIDSIPQIPEHIRQLTELIRDENVDFKAVASLTRKDPALTMDILKMANSVYYKRLNQVEKVDMAISIMGVKGLQYLLQSYGAKQALKQKYAEHDLNQLWKHSSEIAQICSILCDKLDKSDYGEDAYIGGLLHNIGKIVLRGLYPNTIDQITRLCVKKNISVNLIGDLLEGTNYAIIGSKMSSKWNLPEKLTNIIRYQHNPYSSPDDVKEITKIIYLAHIVLNKLNQKNDFYIYSSNILEDLFLGEAGSIDELVLYTKEKLNQLGYY